MYDNRNCHTDKQDLKIKELSDKFAKDNNLGKPKEAIKWWKPVENMEG